MKSIWKRISLLMAVVLLLTGCGKGEGTSENAGSEGVGSKDKAEYVYLPEYYSLNEYVEMVGEIASKGDSLYFSSYNWDEETETALTKMFQYELASMSVTELPFSMESGNRYLQKFWIHEDHSVTAIANEYKIENEETGEGKQLFYFCKYDANGQLISESDITDAIMGETEWAYIQYPQLDSQGNLYFYDSEQNVKGISADGQPTIKVDLGAYCQGIAMTEDDRLFVTHFGTGATGGIVVKEIDIKTGQLSESLENLPESNNMSRMFAGIGKEKLYMQADSDIYEYNLEAKESTKLFNWLDLNMNGDSINNVVQVDEDTFALLETSWSGEEQDNQLVLIKKTKNEGLVEKKVLTLAVSWEDYSVKETVINFNKRSQTHKIEIKVYEPDGDSMSSELLNADIAAGNIPDIMDVGVMDKQSLIKNGVLTDLTPFLEKDSEINRDKLVEKLFEPFTKDEKVYAIPTSFTVSTLMGKSSALGGKTSWNLEDYKAFVESLPEGTKVMDYMTKSSALDMILRPSIHKFVDRENGTCTFDSDEFVAMLEFANTFPEETDYNDEMSLPTKIQSNKLALLELNLSSIEEYQMYSLMFEEPITCIGMPTESGNGSTLVVGSNVFAISENCADKEAAWEFIREFYTLDSQTSGMVWGFPVLKSALEKQFEKAMEPEYIELEDGTKEEVEKTTWGYDDWEAKIYAATPEQVEEVRDLIYNADGVMTGNSGELAIIREESAAYFSGQNSAKELADIIQSRMKIYVSENQ